MIIVSACPVCAREPHESWPAFVSSFIQEYALEEPVALCRLLECGSCGFRYFDLRYEDEELGRLYAGYREPGYQRARQKHERGYTEAFNARLGDDAAERNAALSRFLTRHDVAHVVEPVVDYGGDTGKYIPDAFIGPKYVYDISGKATEPGVERIVARETLAGLDARFFLLAHVLEHVPQPLSLVEEIAAVMRPGARLYVELPYERLDLSWLGRGKGYEAWVALAARHREARRWIQGLDYLSRPILGRAPPFGLLELHEHINFFHEPSLRALLSRAGLKILTIEVEPLLVRAIAERT